MKLYINAYAILIVGVCMAMPNNVWAKKSVAFDLTLKTAIPGMGDIRVLAEGRASWSAARSGSVTGDVTFSSFKYGGSIDYIEQEGFTCSFIKNIDNHVALVIPGGEKAETSKMDSVKINQQYQYAYYVLESLFIVSSLDRNNVTYPEKISVTLDNYKLRRKEIVDIAAPDIYSSMNEESSSIMLRELDASGPMIRYFMRSFDTDGNIVTSLDYEVEKRYYFENSLEFTSGLVSFQVHVPSNTAYNFTYKLINVR